MTDKLNTDALAPYLANGYALIPLHRPFATSTDKRGRLRKDGKRPLHSAWAAKTYDARVTLERFGGTHNIGVQLRDEDLVIDVDPRNGGEKGFAKLCKEFALKPEQWPHVITGSGGSHYYLKKPEDLKVVDTLEGFPGVEFKSKGRQVVAAGSLHPNTRAAYEWDFLAPNLANSTPGPDALLDAIKRPDAPEDQPEGGELSSAEVAKLLSVLDPCEFREHGKWLSLMMACHHASGGEARTEFIEWSAGDDSYSGMEEVNGRRWDSLHAKKPGERVVTKATLFKALKDAGHADMIPRDAGEDFEEPSEPDTKQQKTRGLTYNLASDVEPVAIEWLWPRRFAVGKLGLIAGHPDEGKSQITCFMAATVSTGGKWPDGGVAKEGKTIFLSAEDDVADTINPRLQAAGADLTKCIIVNALVKEKGAKQKRMFNLGDDLERLTGIIEREGDVRLVVIDPISAYLGGKSKADTYKNTEVRALLAPLSDWAARMGVAVVYVTHFNKGGNGRALGRVTDSLAFTALARTAWLAFPEENAEGATGRKLFLKGKLNIAESPGGLAYKIEGVTLAPGITAPHVVWDGEVEVTADEAMGERSKTSSVDNAESYLENLLIFGPMLQAKVKEQAAKDGVSWAAIRLAKDRLGVASKKLGGSGSPWEWRLGYELAEEDSEAA